MPAATEPSASPKPTRYPWGDGPPPKARLDHVEWMERKLKEDEEKLERDYADKRRKLVERRAEARRCRAEVERVLAEVAADERKRMAGAVLDGFMKEGIDLAHLADPAVAEKVKAAPVDARAEVAWSEAQAIADEDVALNQAIGRHGVELLESQFAGLGRPVNILTHCNAGWIATVDWGTVTAPIFMAHGDQDDLVPFSLGQRLYEAAPEPKQFYLMAGTGHNDAIPRGCLTALADFLRRAACLELARDPASDGFGFLRFTRKQTDLRHRPVEQ